MLELGFKSGLMLNRLPLDVSEMIIVYTRSYKSFKNTKEIVDKFNDKRVEERVRDKLTIKTKTEDAIKFTLEGNLSREYNKPCFINTNSYDNLFQSDSVYQRKMFNQVYDLAYVVKPNGSRRYSNRLVCVSENLSQWFQSEKRVIFFEPGDSRCMCIATISDGFHILYK